MAKHTPAQITFIVKRLAAFYTPAEICEQFRANWRDTECQDADIAAVNPDNGILLSPDDDAAYAAERERIVSDMAARWPEQNDAERLLLLGLERDLAVQRARGAHDLANKTRELMAKILGGFFAGKGAAGKPDASTSNEPEITEIRETIVDPAAKPDGA